MNILKNKKKTKAGILLFAAILTLSTMLAGCTGDSQEDKEEELNTESLLETEVNKESESNAISTEEETAEVISINESIMDNFYIEAEFTIPAENIKAYTGSMKSYDLDEIISIFWGDDAKEDVTTEYYDGGTVSVNYNEESISYTDSLGALDYYSGNTVSNMDYLFNFAYDEDLLSSDDLSFLSKDEAVEEVSSLCSQLGIGGELVCTVYSATEAELTELQARMQEDEDYKSLFELGKLSAYDFQEEDEAYYILFSFTIDGISVYGIDDPALLVSGDIDSPALAYEMKGTAIITADGIRMLEIYGAVSAEMSVSDESEVIGYEGIKEALIKEYGDVILTEKYTLKNIWLEYIPLVDGEDGVSVDITPVWCLEIYLDDFETPISTRIHAITGEIIS